MNDKIRKISEWLNREINISLDHAKTPEEEDYILAAQAAVYRAFYRIGDKPDIDLDKLRNLIIDMLYQRPLSPIEDVEESWELIDEREGLRQYQCVRYPSLVKGVDVETGKTRYIDQNRYVCVDVNDPEKIWTGGIGAKVLDELVPITMPYEPPSIPIRVYVESFLYNYRFETVAVAYFLMPDNQLIDVYRYFKREPKHESPNARQAQSFIPIDSSEYYARKASWMKQIDCSMKKGDLYDVQLL